MDISGRMTREQTDEWLANNGYSVKSTKGFRMLDFEYIDKSDRPPKPIDMSGLFGQPR